MNVKFIIGMKGILYFNGELMLVDTIYNNQSF